MNDKLEKTQRKGKGGAGTVKKTVCQHICSLMWKDRAWKYDFGVESTVTAALS